MTEFQKTPWILILLLWCAGLLAAAQFARVALSLEALSDEYPDWPVPFLVSAVAVVGVMFGNLAGGIVGRLGAGAVTRWALVLSAVASGAQVAMPPFPVLVALRIVEGAGHLALVVAIPTLMANRSGDRHRGFVMGLWAAFFGVGFALTSLLAKWLDHTQTLFTVQSLGFLTLAVLLWPFLRGAPAPALPASAGPWAAYGRPRLFAPGLGHGLYASMFIGLMTFLPGTLGAPGLEPILPLIGVGGALVAGGMTQRVRPDLMVIGGFVCASVFFLAASFTDARLAVGLAILAVASSGAVAGAGFAAVPWLSVKPADRAMSNGVLAQLGNVGTFASVPLFAWLEPERVVLGASVMAATSGFLTLLVYRAARQSGGG